MRKTSTLLSVAISGLLLGGPALAAEHLKGEVLGGGAPIADSTVTLWAAGQAAPKELGRTRTDAEGRFSLSRASCARRGGIPLSGRAGRATHGEPGCEQGGQPRHRPDDGVGRQAAGQGHDQRDDDRRVGVDPQPAHRRHRDQGRAAATEDRRRQRAELRRSRDRRLGHDHPGPAQQQPDADHGQLRDARRRAGRVRDAGEGGCVHGALRRGDRSGCQGADRHADGGAGDRPRALVPARTRLRAARSLLSGAAGQDAARGALHALSAMGAQRLGAAAEGDGRRLPRGRQVDVRQRGQPLGRQQLHRGLAGPGQPVAGQRDQVRPQRQAAVAHDHRLCGRRYAGRDLRRGHRRQGQRLAHQLRRQDHHRLR